MLFRVMPSQNTEGEELCKRIMQMEYLKEMPIAVLGSGAVGKTLAADCKLAEAEVRLWGSEEYAEVSINMLDKTGILLDGIQRN